MSGVLACLGLLAALSSTVGLSAAGWAAGILCAAVTGVALALALARGEVGTFGPADRVTLTRATLVCGVAALTADSWSGDAAVRTLVVITVVELALDWVDGQVARRTRTESRFGAQFDMEVDALLVLVLSVYVAGSAGTWVMAIGAARYALLVASWLLPWLGGTMPPRYWAKLIAATQGVVLATASADVLPPALMEAILAVALTLLAVSFGHQAWWLWRHRAVDPRRVEVPDRARVAT